MFKSLRWRIATWFVVVSSLVYLTLTMLAMILFYFSLTALMDRELTVLTSEMGHAVGLRGTVPYFRDWARAVETEPARSLATIQLYNPDGKLLEAYGPKGIPRLVSNQSEAKEGPLSMRITCTPLKLKPHGALVGYMEIQLSTRDRDSATQQFGITMALVAPLVLLGLAIVSYIGSGKAVKPVEDNMKMLRRFMTDAGHELNTPLSIAQARAESYERKLSRQGYPTEELKVIGSSIERMSKIVSDLMLLAEIEGPLATSGKESVDVSSLAAQVVQQFRQRFEEKNVLLVDELGRATIQGYADTLYRLLSNLLENALRYTDEGGSVRMAVVQDNHAVRISVEDTGIGIPAEHLPHIFDRFYRVDKSRSRASGGSGIGLSIVKAITEAHNGSVTCQSLLGQGSKFVVILPFSRQ